MKAQWNGAKMCKLQTAVSAYSVGLVMQCSTAQVDQQLQPTQQVDIWHAPRGLNKQNVSRT